MTKTIFFYYEKVLAIQLVHLSRRYTVKKLFFAVVEYSDPGDTGSPGSPGDAGSDAGSQGANDQGGDGLDSDPTPCDGIVFD